MYSVTCRLYLNKAGGGVGEKELRIILGVITVPYTTYSTGH